MSDEELIDDQYQLVMCIASGSSSQVWEVSEKGTNRHLAMKLLKKNVPEFRANRSKMKRESEILKDLTHPSIVKFEKFSSNRDHTYILMEYFRASNLKLQIKNDLNKVHLRARSLFENVCAALSYVHAKGYLHRDIKPDNVLMNRGGEVRMCDFSLSSKEIKGLGRMVAGKMREIQGTRTYIAPETIKREQPTVRTDIYSLGVMFYEILAAKTPFQATSPEELLQKHLRAPAPNPSEFNPNVSPEMDKLIAKMLKKKPADRQNTVDEVLAEIKRIRIFKADIVDEEAAKKEREDSDALAMMSEIRLDSRADAKLKEMLQTNPEFARKFEIEKQAKLAKKKVADAQQAARATAYDKVDAARIAKKAGAVAPSPVPAAAPVQQMPMMPMPQMPMQGYPPGYPGMPPGYGYPQTGMPMPMPGMAPPMPGQYPAPPQMGYPQPGAPRPQQMVPPAAPVPIQQPVAPPPQQQRPQPPAAPPKSAAPTQRSATPPPSRPVPRPTPPPGAGDGLDFMTELPDVK